ncbi:MAG: hypothetical protein J0M19_13065 [Sphingomonadales bacterium]|nr:hypothetical protein [Sphingomonadales bacterium]
MSKWDGQRWLAALAVGMLAAQAGPIAAQAPAATTVAKPLPANSVDCVYGYMSDEDREMSLLLMAREIVDGGRFRKTSRNVQAVDRLIEEAHQKCLTRFKWSATRSGAATGYALTAILGEALDQALQVYGRPMAALNQFYTANRQSLAGRSDLTKPEEEKLAAHLKSNGWEEASAGEISLAGLYVETLMLKDQAAREFDARPRAARKPIPAQPVPAKKAARGKP